MLLLELHPRQQRVTFLIHISKKFDHKGFYSIRKSPRSPRFKVLDTKRYIEITLLNDLAILRREFLSQFRL